MAKINIDFGAVQGRVVDIMHKNNLTKYKLAQIIQVDKSSITRIFNGERGWGLEMLVSISKEFSVSLDYLIFGKEPNAELERKVKELTESSEVLRKSLLVLLKEKETVNV